MVGPTLSLAVWPSSPYPALVGKAICRQAARGRGVPVKTSGWRGLHPDRGWPWLSGLTLRSGLTLINNIPVTGSRRGCSNDCWRYLTLRQAPSCVLFLPCLLYVPFPVRAPRGCPPSLRRSTPSMRQRQWRPPPRLQHAQPPGFAPEQVLGSNTGAHRSKVRTAVRLSQIPPPWAGLQGGRESLPHPQSVLGQHR